jgi:hypothetical protein
LTLGALGRIMSKEPGSSYGRIKHLPSGISNQTRETSWEMDVHHTIIHMWSKHDTSILGVLDGFRMVIKPSYPSLGFPNNPNETGDESIPIHSQVPRSSERLRSLKQLC